MSEGTCVACGEPTIFEEELGSAICIHCGTLANPSQNILDSHLEHVDNSGRDYYRQNVTLPGGSTLKGRDGRSLAGQDKDARDRRNMVAMHEFISTLATRLSHPGSTLRAQTLFDQAMTRGRFRWGRKAKLVAGAATTIALRETSKNVPLRDIAYLLEEPAVSLARSFTNICLLLQVKVSLFEPAQHLPSLERHLVTLMQSPKESSLPHQLVTALTPLIPGLPAIRKTFMSLATLVSRAESLAKLPTGPSACAIFMLALEGELSASLPHAGALAQALGARVSASKTVVMQRYKAIYDLVEECIKEVPWLDAHERKGKGKGRSKVAKRVVVARGLKDAVQFQDEIWRRKFAETEMPMLVLERDDEVDDGSTVDGSVSSVGSSHLDAVDDHRMPRGKKAKSRHERHVAHVSRFMLYPLAESSAGIDSPSESQSLFEHFLTVDDSALSHVFFHPPTRLQLLTSSRGEDSIGDDELFAEGELEGFLRTQEEVEAVRTAFSWDDTLDDAQQLSSKKRKRSTSESLGDDKDVATSKTKRINMDVLARLLDPSTVVCESDFESQEDDERDGDDETNYTPASFTPVDDPDEIVEEWRPLSPTGGRCGFDEDRYDI